MGDGEKRDLQEPRPETWSVFASFRRSRLALARHLPSLGSALAFAERLRRERFHDRDAVFVVCDRTGEPVAAEAAAPGSGEPPRRRSADRVSGALERATLALRRAHLARVQLAATFERRREELRAEATGDPIARELAQRHERTDASAAAALASMAAAVAAFGGGG